MTNADMIEAMARAYVDAEARSSGMPDGTFGFDTWPNETRRHALAGATAALAVVQPELDRLRALSASLAMEGEDAELCKRLEATRDGVPFGWASSDGRSDIRTPKHLINPEGPEAAARIRTLTAENVALRREAIDQSEASVACHETKSEWPARPVVEKRK